MAPGTISLTALMTLSFITFTVPWLFWEKRRPTKKMQLPFRHVCNKDLVEESLFFHRRHLFSELDIVFFDTTSIYFEGRGGKTIGQRGFSKDHPSGFEADGRRRCDQRQGLPDLLRDVARQHYRCQNLDTGHQAFAGALSHQTSLYRGRSGDDQFGND